jgi:hypothetical protein
MGGDANIAEKLLIIGLLYETFYPLFALAVNAGFKVNRPDRVATVCSGLLG